MGTHESASMGEPDLIMGDVVGVAVGNSRVRVGLIREKECRDSLAIESSDTDAIVERARSVIGDGPDPTIVISSVDPDSSGRIETALMGAFPGRVYTLGRDIPIRVMHTLTDSGQTTVGQDRLLCAMAAHERLGEACVVVDVGTAVTVDFIDGTGVFHGGAILPGISMMLRSLHEGTSALPSLGPGRLELEGSRRVVKRTKR